MKNVEFKKYTSCGNNFVIVDATKSDPFTEEERSGFAKMATNSQFGIGSDNFLVVQNATPRVLKSINSVRSYWSTLPDVSDIDYVFRMFEPDGTEAFSCGNGLMSVARLLHDEYGVDSASMLTEVPFKNPRRVRIGSAGDEAWANMGVPRRVPSQLVNAASRRNLNDSIDLLNRMTIPFREHDLEPYSDRRSLDIEGYLVFTGEPHLVIFPDEIFPGIDLPNTLFGDPSDGPMEASGHTRDTFGSWLVERIGAYINRNCRDLFPTGLNVCFARTNGHLPIVEYRCYERGIEHETLACGTGALAVAYVTEKIWGGRRGRLAVHPVACRQHQPNASIDVLESDDGWVISSSPYRVFDGVLGDKTDHAKTGSTTEAVKSGKSEAESQKPKPQVVDEAVTA